MSEYIILQKKRIDSEKYIALVYWAENNHTPFSTHCIFPKGSSGLYHGNYYSDIINAVENFKERT
jgi:hypothetical protein